MDTLYGEAHVKSPTIIYFICSNTFYSLIQFISTKILKTKVTKQTIKYDGRKFIAPPYIPCKCKWDIFAERTSYLCPFPVSENVKSRIIFFFTNPCHIEIWFPGKKTITFLDESYLKYAKKTQFWDLRFSFFLSEGNKIKQWTHSGALRSL